jgi:acylphosphatase
MTLRDKIKAILKMDDNGRVEKFLNAEVKNFNKFIKQLKSNIVQIDLTYSSAVDTLNDAIEDATIAVDDAYEAVNIEKLRSNAEISYFSKEYWDNITACEKTLETLNAKLVLLEEIHTKDVESINNQIAKYQARIEKIS